MTDNKPKQVQKWEEKFPGITKLRELGSNAEFNRATLTECNLHTFDEIVTLAIEDSAFGSTVPLHTWEEARLEIIEGLGLTPEVFDEHVPWARLVWEREMENMDDIPSH
jgi:hypothetical protein